MSCCPLVSLNSDGVYKNTQYYRAGENFGLSLDECRAVIEAADFAPISGEPSYYPHHAELRAALVEACV
jgi:hypothetical protein